MNENVESTVTPTEGETDASKTFGPYIDKILSVKKKDGTLVAIEESIVVNHKLLVRRLLKISEMEDNLRKVAIKEGDENVDIGELIGKIRETLKIELKTMYDSHRVLHSTDDARKVSAFISLPDIFKTWIHVGAKKAKLHENTLIHLVNDSNNIQGVKSQYMSTEHLNPYYLGKLTEKMKQKGKMAPWKVKMPGEIKSVPAATTGGRKSHRNRKNKKSRRKTKRGGRKTRRSRKTKRGGRKRKSRRRRRTKRRR